MQIINWTDGNGVDHESKVEATFVVRGRHFVAITHDSGAMRILIVTAYSNDEWYGRVFLA